MDEEDEDRMDSEEEEDVRVIIYFFYWCTLTWTGTTMGTFLTFQYDVRPKKKKKKTSDFILDEAEVDDDAEDDEDAWDDDVEGDLPNEREEAGRTARDIEARMRKDRERGFGIDDGEMNEEEMEEFFRNRYNEDAAGLARFGKRFLLSGHLSCSSQFTYATLSPRGGRRGDERRDHPADAAARGEGPQPVDGQVPARDGEADGHQHHEQVHRLPELAVGGTAPDQVRWKGEEGGSSIRSSTVFFLRSPGRSSPPST